MVDRCDNVYCRWRTPGSGACKIRGCDKDLSARPVAMEQLMQAHKLSKADAMWVMQVIKRLGVRYHDDAIQ